jgi:predicted acyl esterase
MSRSIRTLLAAAIVVLLGSASAALALQPASTAADPGRERPEQSRQPDTPPGHDRRPDHVGGPKDEDPGNGNGGDEPERTAPMDYIALAEAGQLSEARYGTIFERYALPMADGTQIHLEITRPDPAEHPGDVPVILEASPYHGTLADRDGTRMFPDPTDEDGNRVGLTGYFAPRGYAVAMMDLRGTGLSSGCLDHLGPNDASDLVEVIDHLTDAEWSSGRVGMTGHSYVGSTPSVAAAQNPRGLKTIVPSAGLASMYDHQFHNGVPWLLQWIGPMVAYEGLALERDLPPELPALPVLGSGNGGENWTENGPNPETGCGLQHSAAISGTGQVTGQYQGWHAERDWREGAAEADIPVFMIHGVHDNAARIPASEWFFGSRFDRSKDKVWIGQWDHGSTNGRCGDADGVRALHPTCRFEQFQYALHAWFDHHLLQTGVPTGPAVEAFLNAEDAVDITDVIDPHELDTKVYAADAWEAPATFLELHPDATDMSLRATAPEEDGEASFATAAEAVLAQVGRGSVTFTSEPVEEETLLLGLSDLTLHATVSNPTVTHLVATLWRVDAEGDREPVDFCAIQPMLRDGVDQLAPVVPGVEMALDLQCFTVAQWLPAGQHLELEISTGSQHHASFASSNPQITVHTGPERTAYRAPMITEFELHDDLPLQAGRTRGGAEDGDGQAPAGQAQPPARGTVAIPAPGGGVIVEPLTAAAFEFSSDEGFDNATVEAVATPALPADLDLYLEWWDGEAWITLAAGESGDLDRERVAGPLRGPGEYRVVVHSWAGPPNQADLVVTFFNGDRVPGTDG